MGRPNGDLSLAEARRNFRDHLTMSRAEDTRCEESPTEVQAKRAIIGAFDRLSAPGPSSPTGASISSRFWGGVMNEVLPGPPGCLRDLDVLSSAAGFFRKSRGNG